MQKWNKAQKKVNIKAEVHLNKKINKVNFPLCQKWATNLTKYCKRNARRKRYVHIYNGILFDHKK